MPFDINFTEKAENKLHVRKFFLRPEALKDVTQHITTKLSWKNYLFSEKNKSKIPASKGVYCFVVIPKVPNFFNTHYLFYVGKTTRTLRTRYSEYLREKAGKGKPRHRVYEMLNLYESYIYFYCSEISSSAEISDIEDKLLNTFVPHINTEIPRAKIKPELRDIYA